MRMTRSLPFQRARTSTVDEETTNRLARKGPAVEVTVLTVADCPNGPLIEARLAQALAGRDGVRVTRRKIDTGADAARFGMRGSPTLLIDGVDPFTAAGTPFSVSCRMYRDDDGPLDGAPSVTALLRALQVAEDGAAAPGADRLSEP